MPFAFVMYCIKNKLNNTKTALKLNINHEIIEKLIIFLALSVIAIYLLSFVPRMGIIIITKQFSLPVPESLRHLQPSNVCRQWRDSLQVNLHTINICSYAVTTLWILL